MGRWGQLPRGGPGLGAAEVQDLQGVDAEILRHNVAVPKRLTVHVTFVCVCRSLHLYTHTHTRHRFAHACVHAYVERRAGLAGSLKLWVWRGLQTTSGQNMTGLVKALASKNGALLTIAHGDAKARIGESLHCEY